MTSFAWRLLVFVVHLLAVFVVTHLDLWVALQPGHALLTARPFHGHGSVV